MPLDIGYEGGISEETLPQSQRSLIPPSGKLPLPAPGVDPSLMPRVGPPSSPEERETRKGRWLQLLSDPAVSAALIQFGASMMRPVPYGVPNTLQTQLSQALPRATAALFSVRGAQSQAAEERKRGAREQQRIDIEQQRADTSERLQSEELAVRREGLDIERENQTATAKYRASQQVIDLKRLDADMKRIDANVEASRAQRDTAVRQLELAEEGNKRQREIDLAKADAAHASALASKARYEYEKTRAEQGDLTPRQKETAQFSQALQNTLGWDKDRADAAAYATSYGAPGALSADSSKIRLAADLMSRNPRDMLNPEALPQYFELVNALEKDYNLNLAPLGSALGGSGGADPELAKAREVIGRVVHNPKTGKDEKLVDVIRDPTTGKIRYIPESEAGTK